MTRQDQIRELYIKYQGAEGQAKTSNAARRDAGLALGKALYELRAQAEVVSGGTTFDSTLKSLGIPHRTAYRWVAKFEWSVGIRPPAPAVAVSGRKPDIHGLYYDPKDPLSRISRTAALRMCANARLMATKGASLLGNPSKVAMYAEACKDRDQLDRLVRDLQSVQRAIELSLPVVEAVLAATPTVAEEAAMWARVRAEERAEDTKSVADCHSITESTIQ